MSIDRLAALLFAVRAEQRSIDVFGRESLCYEAAGIA